MLNLPTFHVALLVLDLQIPASQSLKDKRRVIKSLKDRVRGKFNCSVAEVGELDKWQRSVCAVAMVGNDQRKLESAVSAVHSLVGSIFELQILSAHTDYL